MRAHSLGPSPSPVRARLQLEAAPRASSAARPHQAEPQLRSSPATFRRPVLPQREEARQLLRARLPVQARPLLPAALQELARSRRLAAARASGQSVQLQLTAHQQVRHRHRLWARRVQMLQQEQVRSRQGEASMEPGPQPARARLLLGLLQAATEPSPWPAAATRAPPAAPAMCRVVAPGRRRAEPALSPTAQQEASPVLRRSR